jgi:hypothetical protein
MPYIRSIDRDRLDYVTDALSNVGIKSAGELNYLITKLVDNYLIDNGKSYQYYNDCIGALEGAKLELYRRCVAPYEDIKLMENGDVYFA